MNATPHLVVTLVLCTLTVVSSGALAAWLSRLSRGVAPLPWWVRWVVLVLGVASTPVSFLAM